jgi:hypothetical protein
LLEYFTLYIYRLECLFLGLLTLGLLLAPYLRHVRGGRLCGTELN